MAGKSKYAGLGIALGAAAGAAAGVLAGHVAIWLALGVAIGVVIGANFRRRGIDCPECAVNHRHHVSPELNARPRSSQEPAGESARPTQDLGKGVSPWHY